MSRPADVVNLGVLPLQHHEPGFDLDLRWLVAGWRVARAPGAGQPIEPAEGSTGDLLGATLWERERNPEKGVAARPIAGWSFAWPAVTTRGPVETRPGATMTREEAAQADENGVRPIGDEKHKADGRFKERPASVPSWASRYPKGWTGQVGSASKELAQVETWHPDALGLVAPHAGPTGKVGTAIVDTAPSGEVDPTRRALLQKFARVVKGPSSGLVALGENAVAWQLGPDRIGKTGGYGLVADEVPESSGGGADERVETPGGGSGGGKQRERVETPGGTGLEVPEKGEPPSTSERETPPEPPSQGSGAILACMGASAGGPLHVGGATDIHRIGGDADGSGINAGHISTRAILYGPQGDAGIAIEPGPFPEVVPCPYPVPAHMRFNPRAAHEWIGGVGPGQFQFFAESVWGVIPPRKPPRRPPPTPGDPRTPPTPPGPPRPLPPPPPPPPGPTPGGGAIPGSTPRDLGAPEEEWKPRLPYDPFGNPPEGPRKGHRFGPPDWLEPWEPRRPSGGVIHATTRSDLQRPIAVSSMEVAAPGFLVRPQSFGCGEPDLRNEPNPSAAALAKRDAETPVVMRTEGAFARVGATCNRWGRSYTHKPGLARYPGGTASGTVADFPGEVGFEDAATSYAPGFARSTVYRVGLAGQVHYGTGLPDPMGGAPKSGQMWGQTTPGGAMVFRSTTAAGAVSKTRTLPEADGTIALVETQPLMGIRFSNGTVLRSFSVVDATLEQLADLVYTACYDLATTGELTGYTIEDRVGTYEIDCESYTLYELADLVATVIDLYQSSGYLQASDYGITNRRTRFALDCDDFTMNQLAYVVTAMLGAMGV